MPTIVFIPIKFIGYTAILLLKEPFSFSFRFGFVVVRFARMNEMWMDQIVRDKKMVSDAAMNEEIKGLK
jgi:hypothetical protein